MSTIHPAETTTVFGVEGRYHGATVGGTNYRPGTFTMQRWSASRPITFHGDKATLRVSLRFDDSCRNGANTFGMTADVLSPDRRRRDPMLACGCLHDDIAKHFPSLAHLAKWHLCGTDGPLHYEANTVYLAGDRDHNGHRAGTPSRWSTVVRFGTSPIGHKIGDAFAKWLQDPDVRFENLEVLRIGHDREPETYGPKFTFGGYLDRWHQCPFNTEDEALEWLQALCGPHKFEMVPTAWSDGKRRELDAARRAAIWPDATDEELSAEPDELRAKLRERLPRLLAAFRADMEACGFAWAPPEE